MGQVLYRKYRSKNLDEIVGQEHITTTLKKALKTSAISHAYLFTGPRGVGKTSIARILAHELNELPYTGEDMHLDIIEIDAASNRGIDEIRDLREKVHIAPSSGKYKVYIIDEVHMLTTPAFNALLKTLEEPPEHAVFILATTEAHKLPETIISRTQRYAFRPVSKEKVVEHLAGIAKKEKIHIDDAALQLIAEHGEGSFRDSISLLNQAANHADRITATAVQDILGIPPNSVVNTLLESTMAGDKQAIVLQLSRLHAQGTQAPAVAKLLGQLGRESILSDSSENEQRLLTLLANLLDVPTSNSPQHLLEIVLLKAAVQSSQATTTAVGKPVRSKRTEVKQTKPETSAADTMSVQTDTEKKPTPQTKPTSEPVDLETVWPSLLDAIKTRHNTVYGILRMAIPSVEDETLVLTFKYNFHQKRMSEPKHQAIIATTLVDISGYDLAIECRYDKDVEMNRPTMNTTADDMPPELPPEDPQMATISNIFGGAELLES